jgi:hypothetical protein
VGMAWIFPSCIVSFSDSSDLPVTMMVWDFIRKNVWFLGNTSLLHCSQYIF